MVHGLRDRDNTACAADDRDEIRSCLDRLECFNEEGIPLPSGLCQTGTCANGDPCRLGEPGRSGFGFRRSNQKSSCADCSRCTPLASTCTREPLRNATLDLDFEPPGPAGSHKACEAAERNACTILPGKEAACRVTKTKGAETCP
jgi:hypothetical protein